MLENPLTPEQLLVRKRARLVLAEALDALPQKYQQVLVLRIVFQFTRKELAAMLDIVSWERVREIEDSGLRRLISRPAQRQRLREALRAFNE